MRDAHVFWMLGVLALAQVVVFADDEVEKLLLEARSRVVNFERDFTQLQQLRTEAHHLRERFEKVRDRDPQAARELAARNDAMRQQIEQLDRQVSSAVEPLRQLLDKVTTAAPNDPWGWRMQAMVAGLGGDGRTALAAMNRAIALDADSLELRFDRGLFAYRAMDWSQAVEDLKRCLQANFSVAECRQPYAYSLVWSHDFAAAVEVLDQLLAEGSSAQKDEIKALRAMASHYIPLWQREQQIRLEEARRDDLPRMKLVTTRGELLVELFEDHAPNTVAHIITLVEQGFYDGTRFHARIAQYSIQGGCPYTRRAEDRARHGTGHPGYLVPDELDSSCRDHFAGSLSMANAGVLDTNGSQFIVSLVPAGWLNVRRAPNTPPLGNTVFGRIIAGLDVARALDLGDELIRAEILRKRDHPYEVKYKRPAKLHPDLAQPR
jgi:cyclophilin family peptidyl-prolyl cis-trans isomerase